MSHSKCHFSHFGSCSTRIPLRKSTQITSKVRYYFLANKRDVQITECECNKQDVFFKLSKTEYRKFSLPPNLAIFLALYICTCLHTWVPAYLTIRLPDCLPTWLPTRLTDCLPTGLPAFLLYCLPTWLPAYLTTCPHGCLPAHPPRKSESSLCGKQWAKTAEFSLQAT